MKVFANADCTQTALFGRYLHYEVAPGQWEDVDLNLEQRGQGYVMDEHELSVRILGAAVEVTRRDSGEGIRWLTPAVPQVAGRSASFEDGGMTWRYTIRKTGVKLEADVSNSLGPRTYEFAYQMLGGASDFLEDPRGDLVSDGFGVPRALVLGADGESYQAGAWRLLSGERIAFDFDDSSMPAAAFPYVLDPTTVFDLGGPDAQSFSGGDSGDDGSVQAGGSSYPPLVSWANDPAETFIIVRRDREGNGAYRISNGLIRWDTSALPDTAEVISAELQVSPAAPAGYEGAIVPGCPVEDEDLRRLTADWYSAWPIDSTDYSFEARTGALAGVWLHDLEQDLVDPETSKILLDNADGVSTTGHTGLRLHISGGEPTGRNSVCLAAFDDTDLPEPRLAVTYHPDIPIVESTSTDRTAYYAGEEVVFQATYRILHLDHGQFKPLFCRTPNLNLQTKTCTDSFWEEEGGNWQWDTGNVSRAYAYLNTLQGHAENTYQYYAFVCSEYVCSPNYKEGRFMVFNRTPFVDQVVDYPNVDYGVAPGTNITFTVDWTDTPQDSARILICDNSTGLTGLNRPGFDGGSRAWKGRDHDQTGALPT